MIWEDVESDANLERPVKILRLWVQSGHQHYGCAFPLWPSRLYDLLRVDIAVAIQIRHHQISVSDETVEALTSVEVELGGRPEL